MGFSYPISIPLNLFPAFSAPISSLQFFEFLLHPALSNSDHKLINCENVKDLWLDSAMVGGNSNGYVDNNSFSKTICSICFEDLKPLIEDLQSISVCGHVFHELCLQQWFEYCPKLKKKSCPICKQTCTNTNVGRLYFQSVGDTNDSSLSQKPRDYEENPEQLRKEVNRLEGKVVALASSLEQQQKEFKEVKDEFLSCAEQLKIEVTLRKQALAEKTNSQQLLRMKTEELDKSTLECMRVQERNMALAKELAAIKLVSDLNLEEDEVMKLASLGNDAGSRETVDVLRKSLVIRNKNYKELMAKCNILGRGEARSLRKLEKANEKIKKLKLRVQELEAAVEIKDNEALRVLKDQDCKFETHAHENMMKRNANPIDLDETRDMLDDSFRSRKVEHSKPMSGKSTINDIIHDQNDQEKGPSINEDENIVRSSTSVHGLSCKTPMTSANNAVNHRFDVSMQHSSFDTQNEVEMLKPGVKDGVSCTRGLRKCRKGDKANRLPADVDDEVICYGDTNPVDTSLHIRKETTQLTPFPQPGDNCFSGGLLGPDGTNWHLGKWCKKGQNQGSTTLSEGLQRPNARSGDLIAVGADGRGGKIKVMRSLHQSSLDIKDTSYWAKKSKHGARTNMLQPQGCLQIEHFFQRRTAP
ncbi:hypothetical protein BUALT_Bualt01G0232800 [Buddleja alternifolia]|uniref:RING-type domain-containing protein n=1 Tax=Buddleja alternifolia TaxID=168488 RepID=A0AAV6YGC4_9LAMI|nr:hypothetical protein BUALT_Bualt01G0232800 [Buddleja alternifolia]